MDMSIDSRYKAMNKDRPASPPRRQAAAPSGGFLKPLLAFLLLAALGVAAWYFWLGGDKSDLLGRLGVAREAPRPPGKVTIAPSSPAD